MRVARARLILRTPRSIKSATELVGQMIRGVVGTGMVLACLLLVHGADAADPVQMVLKDHHFTPDAVTVPAGERFRIEVTNQDDTPAEFESSDLRVEKIVVPGAKISRLRRAAEARDLRLLRRLSPAAGEGHDHRRPGEGVAMLASALIVFREVLEAGLIVGIVLAATQGIAGRGR